ARPGGPGAAPRARGRGVRPHLRRHRRGGGRLLAPRAVWADREPALHRLVLRRDRAADRRRPALRRDAELSHGGADLGRLQRARHSHRARAAPRGWIGAPRPASRGMICYHARQHLTEEDDMPRAPLASLAVFTVLMLGAAGHAFAHAAASGLGATPKLSAALAHALRGAAGQGGGREGRTVG